MYPFLKKLFADGDYQGPEFHTALTKLLPQLETEIIKRSDHAAVSEAAGAPDYEGVSWHMLLMPSKTPRPIAERLHTEMKRIMAARAAVGLIPNDSPSIEEMRGYIASEHVKWGALVKQLGLEGSQ